MHMGYAVARRIRKKGASGEEEVAITCEVERDRGNETGGKNERRT